MRYTVPLTAATLLATAASSGAAQGPQVARDAAITSVFLREPGVVVEGAGLERWTFATIQDSLDVYFPGSELIRGTCGAELRELPLFKQAVVRVDASDSAVTVFLAVIEPQDSALLTVRPLGADTTKSSAPWPALVKLVRTRFTAFREGIVANVEARAAGLPPRVTLSTRADSVELTTTWHTLAAHRTAEDLATARQVLTTSPNFFDRMAAVAIVSNFDQDDTAWHALVGALLDPNDLVREYAQTVLRTFTANVSRPVDWRPATAELHALLQGSDLWSLHETLDMLVATGVTPELAAPLLKDGGHAVLMYAGALHPIARGPAHRFLHAVSGKNLGGNPGRWRAWIATL